MLEREQSVVAEDVMDSADFYTDGPTIHHVIVHDEDENRGGYTPCVLDALNAAAMENHVATVRSTDPMSETDVTATFTDHSVQITPTDAVISIGQNPDPAVELESRDSDGSCRSHPMSSNSRSQATMPGSSRTRGMRRTT